MTEEHWYRIKLLQYRINCITFVIGITTLVAIILIPVLYLLGKCSFETAVVFFFAVLLLNSKYSTYDFSIKVEEGRY